MSKKIFAIAEQIDGSFRKITYEILSEGKRLAEANGCTLSAVVLGSGMEANAGVLKKYGADRILVADAPVLSEYMHDTYSHVLSGVIEKEAPEIILFGASIQGKELSACLATRLEAALATDCIGILWEDDIVKATRPMYGGKILTDVRLEGELKMISIRPNSMDIETNIGAGSIEMIDTIPKESTLKVIGKKMEIDKVDITEADIVISGGRGMGGSDFTVIEQLAGALGGTVGASRSAVDEGWRAHADQVGQTGKIVSPNLYFACGISGAIQHLAGMSSSKVVVAVNKDKEAPIFSKVDYGVVGDLFEIIPPVIKSVDKIKQISQ